MVIDHLLLIYLAANSATFSFFMFSVFFNLIKEKPACSLMSHPLLYLTLIKVFKFQNMDMYVTVKVEVKDLCGVCF